MDSHKLHKFLEADLPSLVRIEVGHGHINKASGGIESPILLDCFSEVKRCQHAVMVIIQIVKHLFEHLNISFISIGCNELLRIEVYVSLCVSETAFHFLLRSQAPVFTQPE